MAARWRPCVLLAAVAHIQPLGGTSGDAGGNRYCASELGQYDAACAATAPPTAPPPSSGSSSPPAERRSGWGADWGAAPLRWLWGTPIYSAPLKLSKSDRDELVRLITTQYFRIEDMLAEGGRLPPAEVNDAFYTWQQDLDHQWMADRDICFDRNRLERSGPPADGEPAADREARQACEQQAQNRHWPELRQSTVYARLYAEVVRLCQNYLDELNLRNREERGSFEYDADGKELIWTWASVHHDGIEHFLHDHPASLLSGTLYLQVPEHSGWLRLQDPRESRKGGTIYNVDLMFEHWNILPEGSTGMSELLKLSAAIVLLHFDLALLTFGFGCCGCARAQKAIVVLQLAVATASLLGVGWLLWLMACTDYDDDIDFPFGGTYGVEPSNGRIVVFPGWLLHEVEPSDVPSDTPRVAVSFNIRGVWKPTGSTLSETHYSAAGGE